MKTTKLKDFKETDWLIVLASAYIGGVLAPSVMKSPSVAHLNTSIAIGAGVGSLVGYAIVGYKNYKHAQVK